MILTKSRFSNTPHSALNHWEYCGYDWCLISNIVVNCYLHYLLTIVFIEDCVRGIYIVLENTGIRVICQQWRYKWNFKNEVIYLQV